VYVIVNMILYLRVTSRVPGYMKLGNIVEMMHQHQLCSSSVKLYCDICCREVLRDGKLFLKLSFSEK